MSIYTYNGQILVVDGKIAGDANCCCGAGECRPCCQCWRFTASVDEGSGSGTQSGEGCAELTGTLEDDNCVCRVSGNIDICECASGEGGAGSRCDGEKIGTLSIDELLVVHDRAVCQVTYTPLGSGSGAGSGAAETSWWMPDTSIDTASCDTTLDFNTTLPSGASVSITVDACTGESCGCAQAQDCPTDYSTCDDSITATVTGFSGSCCMIGESCNEFNGTDTLWRGSSTWITDNPWNGASFSSYARLFCSGREWYFRLTGYPIICAEFTAPNTDGCPPTSGWVFNDTDGCCTGDPELTLEY